MGRSSGNVHQRRLPPIIKATRPLSVAGEAGSGGARMTGGCGTGASETGGVAGVAAPDSVGDARETMPSPPWTMAITNRRVPGIPVERRVPRRVIRDRPVRLLCARFLRAMCVVTGGNYTSRSTPGPRNGPGRERHSFPGTARASATEVDVRRAGVQAPGEGVGNFVERSPVRGQLLEGGQFRESHNQPQMNREFPWLFQPV